MSSSAPDQPYGTDADDNPVVPEPPHENDPNAPNVDDEGNVVERRRVVEEKRVEEPETPNDH